MVHVTKLAPPREWELQSHRSKHSMVHVTAGMIHVTNPVNAREGVTLRVVRELRAFVAKHRADYLHEGKDSDG